MKPGSPTTLPIPQPGNSPSSYGCLCFFALTASSEHFRLKSLELPLPLFLPLYDNAEHDVGRMGLDGGTYPTIGKYLLIVLSDCFHRVQQGVRGSDLPTAIIPSSQRREGDEGELPFFNVMLIRWTGGVAERVGLGWMWKADAQPFPKLFLQKKKENNLHMQSSDIEA